MKAVTSSHHLLIFVFDKKRRIVCPFQHTGTICSLMHIDVRIKANQAGRHHPYHPPAALPPCSHLFVPVLKHEYQTCPADSPSNAPQWLRVTLSLPLPQRSPFILHTSIGVSCTPDRVLLQWCILVSKSMPGPAGVRAQQVADWQILPWTLTQIALGKERCVAIPYVPMEYAVTYLLYFSGACLRAPPVLTHSSFLPSLCPPCLRTCVLNWCKVPRVNNLRGVTFRSPSPHFLRSISPGECHIRPSRWREIRKGRALPYWNIKLISVYRFKVRGRMCLSSSKTNEERSPSVFSS